MAVLALFVLVLAGYYFAIRPGLLTWGATAEEQARPMPGDDLVARPNFRATRAITVAGRPEDIWPWIVQIGYDRAGFYGYDLIENLGSRTGLRSADRIVPELQHLADGDRVYMSRIAYLVARSVTRNQSLMWLEDRNPPANAFTWQLDPLDAGHTRVILRIRLRYHWTEALLPLDLFVEFTDHVAVPKMLAGIRDRVEGRPLAPLFPQALEIALWLAAFMEFMVAAVFIVVRRRWGRAWIAAILAAGALAFALYAREPLWIGWLLQVPVLAALIRV